MTKFLDNNWLIDRDIIQVKELNCMFMVSRNFKVPSFHPLVHEQNFQYGFETD